MYMCTYSEISGYEFTQVGNSLVRYGKEELFYNSARRRCVEAFGANIVEFRNEQEWIEVLINEAVYLCYLSVVSQMTNTPDHSKC